MLTLRRGRVLRRRSATGVHVTSMCRLAAHGGIDCGKLTSTTMVAELEKPERPVLTNVQAQSLGAIGIRTARSKQFMRQLD